MTRNRTSIAKDKGKESYFQLKESIIRELYYQCKEISGKESSLQRKRSVVRNYISSAKDERQEIIFPMTKAAQILGGEVKI